MKMLILPAILLSLIVSGCMAKKTVSKHVNSTTTNNNPVVQPTSTTDPTPIVDPVGPVTDAYTLGPIVIHGATGGVVQWSSATDPDWSANQSVFLTDSRLSFKFRALTSPGKTYDTYGRSCLYYALPYTKLQAKIKVKTAAGATQSVTVEANNNSWSTVKSMNMSLLVTDSPLIVEISDVKWDYSCIDYANRGFPNQTSVCPWDYVWVNDCVKFELLMATDGTSAL